MADPEHIDKSLLKRLQTRATQEASTVNDLLIRLLDAPVDVPPPPYHHTEAQFRQLIEVVPSVIIISDSSGKITFANERITTVFGYAPEELIGETTEVLLPENRRDLHASLRGEYFENPMTRPMGQGHDLQGRHKDGSVFPIEIDLSYLTTDLGIQAVAILTDISPRKHAQEAYQTLVENSLQGFAIIQHNALVFVNPQLAKILGYPIDELLTYSWEQIVSLIHPEDRDRLLEHRHNLTAGKDIFQDIEYRILKKDNTTCWVETFASLIHYRGRPAIQVAYNDITERKQAEEMLRHQNDLLRSLQEISLELQSQFDLNELLKNIVMRATQLMGASGGFLDLIDPLSNELTPKVGIGVLADALAYKVQYGEGIAGTVWQTGESLVINDYDTWEDRIANFTPHGLGPIVGVPLLSGTTVIGVLGIGYIATSQRTPEIDSIPILTQFAQLASIAIENARLLEQVQQELADRKQVEQALREGENRLRQAMHIAQLGIWDWDITTDKTIWHGEMFRIYGVTPEEFTGKGSDYIDFTRQDYREAQGDNISLAFANGVSEEQLSKGVGINFEPKELCIVRPDGSEKYTLGDAVAIVDANGNPVRLLGVTIDITDRKQAEIALRESEARYKALFNGSIHPIIVYDDQARFLMINDVGIKNLATTLEEVIGKPLEYYLPDMQESTVELIQQVLSSQSPMYTEDYIELVGGGRWFSSILQPVLGQGNKSVQVISYDITERKQAELALRESEARLRSLVETQSAFVIRIDLNGNYNYVNQAFNQRYDWLRRNNNNTILGLPALTTIEPEDHDKVYATVKTCTASPGKSVQVTLKKKKQDGGFFWSLWEFVAISDDAGQATEIQCIGFDITEEKHNEQLMLENGQLKVSFKKEQEQNALIQKTISALSHDLRTPLTAISMAKDILGRYFDQLSPEKRQEKIESIERQLQYALDLLDDTTLIVKSNLNYRIFNPMLINMETLCRISIEEISAVYNAQNRLIFENIGGIQTVLIDEILLSRILLNLLSNAIKYSPDGGEIRLELDRRDAWIMVRIIDHGMGISADDLPHIFDPFFRADEVESIDGTGLGLSIVKDCVERHQGQINVESALGQGTTFVIELPMRYEVLAT